MKKLNSVIIIFFVFLSSEVYSQDCSEVTIKTNNSSAMIYINNQYLGDQKVSVSLKVGEYDLLIIERNRGWDAQKFQERIEVESCDENIDLFYEFEETAFINSIPQNSSISYNDSTIAYTPGFIPISLENISVMKPDYENLDLLLDTKSKDIMVTLKYNGVQKKEHFVDSPWFTVLIGSAVVFGATAAYYKIQADQQFERYNETHERSLLTDVDRYDLYSGIAFGILQVNFGYLIYKFIFGNP